jgi:hypothetical protein
MWRALAAVRRTSFFRGDAFFRPIRTATTSMTTPNSNNSFWPSNAFPSEEPATEPKNPDAAKTVAHAHLTRPARARGIRLTRAFTATALAPAPIATCGSPTPTK